jgi:hypothetical protein
MNDPHTKNHRPLLEGCSQAWQHRLSHQVKKKWKWQPICQGQIFHINERKPLSMTVAKGVSNNGEHTLIPVMAKVI